MKERYGQYHTDNIGCCRILAFYEWYTLFLTMNDQVVEITTDESLWSMQEEGAVYLENTKRLLIKSTQERLELSWSN